MSARIIVTIKNLNNMKTKISAIVFGTFFACAIAAPAQSVTAAKLNPKAYAPFELGELKPEGWLKEWAQRAAEGMTKTIGINYTEFAKGWASADEPGWWHYEQTGYYTDGFVRLAYLLGDEYLMNRSRSVMDAVVARQKPNGYIMSTNKDYTETWGKVTADHGLYWSEAVFCRSALAYYSATKDRRVLEML